VDHAAHQSRAQPQKETPPPELSRFMCPFERESKGSVKAAQGEERERRGHHFSRGRLMVQGISVCVWSRLPCSSRAKEKGEPGHHSPPAPG
jgi:hypothetical protein